MDWQLENSMRSHLSLAGLDGDGYAGPARTPVRRAGLLRDSEKRASG